MKIENCKFPRGFTLIELLVVIAIISLLVSILLPSLNRAKDLAKRVICASNLKNCGMALITYANENDSWFPSRGCNSWSDVYRWPDYANKAWDDYISLGLLIEGDYVPPDFTYENTSYPVTEHPLSGLLFCPGGERQRVSYWSSNHEYALCDSYWYVQPYKSSTSGGADLTPLRLNDMPTTVLMADYMKLWSNGAFSGFWHGLDGLNALFVDGSASWVSNDELYDYFEPYVGGTPTFAQRLQAIKDCWEEMEKAR